MAKTRKRAKPTIIVGLIHASWCGHCKTTIPEWKLMKKMLKSYSKIKCVKIEQSEEESRLPSINSTYLAEGQTPISSSGYPTIFRIENGVAKYYNGERTAVKMFNWATGHGKHGGEGEVPPSIYNAKNTPLTMGGKSRKFRKTRKISTRKNRKSSWLSFWG